MKAYTGTLKTKQEAVDLAQMHQDADKFIQGNFWDDDRQKGCSVGCMVHDYRKANNDNISWHQATEPLYGIPRALSRLQDRIFEGLPISKAKLWTVRFMDAIPEGKDLSMVINKFLYWLLTDPDGLIKHATPKGKKSIVRISELFARRLKGDEPKLKEWQDARTAAYAASSADAAAASAAYAAAASAAYAAYAAAASAYAADAAAASAYAAYAAHAAAYAAHADAAYAYAAADAAAYYAAYAASHAAHAAAYARKAFYEHMADKLIEILGE